MTGQQVAILRVEAAAGLGLAVWLYAALGGSWWVFAALALAPDIFAVGYLIDRRTGAAAYNAAHTLAVPLAYGGIGAALGWDGAVLLAAIHVAHIEADRAIGYGLKRAADPWRTHLQP